MRPTRPPVKGGERPREPLSDPGLEDWGAPSIQKRIGTSKKGLQGGPELATEIHAASLMAIEVETSAERAYLGQLASDIGLTWEATRRIEQLVGL
jgi:hypothetical protein